MKLLKQILKFLNGKKTIIAGILMTTAAYMAVREIITSVDATYINAIVTLIFGSASVATHKLKIK